MQPSQFFHRPISEDGFPVDEALVDWAEVAAVVRHGAVIAEHEIAVGRNRHLGIGAGIGILIGDVVFVEGFVVDEDLTVFYADTVSSYSDDALDVSLGGVPGIAEDYDVAALDGLPAVDELIDEDALLVFEAGHHAGAFDFHRLVEKDNDEGGDGERDEQIARPDSNYRQRTRRILRRRSLLWYRGAAWVGHRGYILYGSGM